MKILFYGTRDYDQIFFDRLKPEYPDIEFTFLESNLYKETASLTAGYDGICAFVNADLGAEVIEELRHQGIRRTFMPHSAVLFRSTLLYPAQRINISRIP